MKNETDEQVLVSWKSKYRGDTLMVDTLAPGEIKILFTRDSGLSCCNEDRSNCPVYIPVNDLLYIDRVFKNDSLVSDKDYTEDSNWNYERTTYLATVTEEEFH